MEILCCLMLQAANIFAPIINYHMKAIFLSMSMFLLGTVAFAADTVDSVKVSGMCGSCKKRIEKAALDAGAKTAQWSDETQILKVTYDENKTTLLVIEKKIASVGHDTRDVKASDIAYKALDECCQYDRKS